MGPRTFWGWVGATIQTAAGVLIVAAMLYSCAYVGEREDQRRESIAGFQLPIVHLDKQAADRFTVSHGLCNVGGNSPRRVDDRLQAGTSMACADSAGYKIVQFRLAARLYARRAVWLPWHRYSISLTTDAHNWQGGFGMPVNDVCHVGAGLSWYQVRWSGTMTWSHPTSGLRGTEHYSGRQRSLSRHDCSGHE